MVGDIHGRWDAEDVRLLDEAGYDGVLVVGDLAGLRFGPAERVARSLATLRTPTVFVPGNHDGANALHLLGAVTGQPLLGRPFDAAFGRNLQTLREAVGPHALGAYSRHRFGDLTVIAARPHSMGGPTLSFADHLQATWGVGSLDASAARLQALVDGAETERLVFVAHNGPTGLGSTRSSPWGCDFRAAEGDWGDPDLETAITYAKRAGRRVLAVCAGHMHRKLRGGGQRTWRTEQDGTLYLNAAEVPRIRKDGRRHHVRLELHADHATAEDVWA